MRIGIVCPYSFDAPGGVQVHIMDLAAELRSRGHQVDVLAPGTLNDVDSAVQCQGVTLTGSGYRIRYNGSVAPLSLTWKSFKITRKWLKNGDFDVVHIHEPLAPSISLIALLSARSPLVATHHTSGVRMRAMLLSRPLLRPWIRRMKGRIAVSNEARRTLVEHLGEDAVIIPNGVYTQNYRNVKPHPQWQATAEQPVFSFLGRLDESRKGLPVLLAAIPKVLQKYPQARFLIAGRGQAPQAQQLAAEFPRNVELLGGVSELEKAQLFAGSTAYIAPQTGGESFGIVLVEAMSAGTLVVASDLEAFRLVLDDGKYGELFATADAQALAQTLCAVLEKPGERAEKAQLGQRGAARFDWSSVTDRIEVVYRLARAQKDTAGHDYRERAALLLAWHKRESDSFTKHVLRKHYNQLVAYGRLGGGQSQGKFLDYCEEEF